MIKLKIKFFSIIFNFTIFTNSKIKNLSYVKDTLPPAASICFLASSAASFETAS